MAITTRDELIDALGNNSSRIVIDKATIANQTVGGFCSLWRSAGTPGQGAIPTTAAICTKALTGAFGFTNQTDPVTSYHGWQTINWSQVGGSVEFHDRLAHMGGLSGIVTTAQGALTLSGLAAARLGSSDYSDVQWWLEWYTDTGATAANAVVNVTYNDDSTGNLANIAIGGTVRASRMLPLVSAVAGKFIKAVNSVTHTTTGTAGNYGITATRPRTAAACDLANKATVFNWADLGMPEVPNDACYFMIVPCIATSTGTLRGSGKIAHG